MSVFEAVENGKRRRRRRKRKTATLAAKRKFYWHRRLKNQKKQRQFAHPFSLSVLSIRMHWHKGNYRRFVFGHKMNTKKIKIDGLIDSKRLNLLLISNRVVCVCVWVFPSITICVCVSMFNQTPYTHTKFKAENSTTWHA